MAGRIPQTFINELLARADVVDVIESRITLKKSGRNFSACCPFHNEKTPSFSVSPEKQFYYCFGCGASGNALTFLMEYEGLDFVAAIEDLAAQLALEVPREAYDQAQPALPDLFPMMEKVASFYQQQLKLNPRAKKAINYLKDRGLSGEIAKQYGLGYAPDEWQNLLTLDKDQSQLQDDLVETGMMVKKDNGRCYDRFRDRIMFPIRNRRGQVLGFGGRVIDQGEPKYLNSPETRLFHKGNELYGLFEMRRQLRKIDHIIIVEGYMDVVALAQFGIYNTTATLGTATSSEHLQTLFKICPKVVFCFDGDRAGRAAALRALQHALPLLKDAREVRLMFLPDGEDPDSMVRNIGSDAFKIQVDEAVTLFDYLIEHLTGQVDMKTFEGPARLIHLAKPFYQSILDPILSARFEQKLSELSDLNQEQVRQAVAPMKEPAQQNKNTHSNPANSTINSKNKSSRPNQTHSSPANRPSQQHLSAQPAEEFIDSHNNQPSLPLNLQRAISLLLQYPKACPAKNLDWMTQASEFGIELVHQICALINQVESITTAMLIENWRDNCNQPELNRLASMELHSNLQNAQLELNEIFDRLEKQYLLVSCDKLIEQSKLRPLSRDEKETLSQLLKQTAKLR